LIHFYKRKKNNPIKWVHQNLEILANKPAMFSERVSLWIAEVGGED